MKFEEPQPFNDVMQLLQDKQAMPTPLSTAELSSLSKDIRKISLYSARTTNAAYLEQVRKQLSDLAAGKINVATATQNLQTWLHDVGEMPASGYNAGLTDLFSDRRIKLMLETNIRIASNTAFAASGLEANALHDWPCYEFLRIYTKQHPRGSTASPADVGWPEAWVRSGGTLVDGERMIAPKTSDIWGRLSDSGVWADGTDSDVPPFKFNSGYGWDEISRKEAVALGVIDSDDEQGGQPPSLLGDFFADPAKATLGDIAAKRSDILAALVELRRAA